jgi:HSP20 family protein
MIYRPLWSVPRWAGTDVLDELNRMQQFMGRLTDAFQTRGGARPAAWAGVFPAVNLSEDQDGYFVRAELPGVNADDLDIRVEGRHLTIAGQRTIAMEGDKVCYHRREREGGKFSRVLGLPGDIDAEKVTARLVNGILTVQVPKAATARPRQISVQ